MQQECRKSNMSSTICKQQPRVSMSVTSIVSERPLLQNPRDRIEHDINIIPQICLAPFSLTEVLPSTPQFPEFTCKSVFLVVSPWVSTCFDMFRHGKSLEPTPATSSNVQQPTQEFCCRKAHPGGSGQEVRLQGLWIEWNRGEDQISSSYRWLDMHVYMYMIYVYIL